MTDEERELNAVAVQRFGKQLISLNNAEMVEVFRLARKAGEISDPAMSGQKLWNVKLPVVELVRATTPEIAASYVRTRLEAAGFMVYDGEKADVFESEDIGEDAGHDHPER
jgi:hypothetical protein